MSNITAIHGDSEVEIRKIPSESIDIICMDPPYLYLVGQRLERPFDEQAFFTECKRVLTKDGMIIMFGRGESFYRWNTILSSLGLKFKEEIVWNKIYTSSPLLNISRVHETISIFSKGGERSEGKGALPRDEGTRLRCDRHGHQSLVYCIWQPKVYGSRSNVYKV